MNLSTATAGTRYETGSRDKHRSMMSMVKSRLCYQSHQAMSDLGLKSTNAHSKPHSLCQAPASLFGIGTLASGSLDACPALVNKSKCQPGRSAVPLQKTYRYLETEFKY